MDPVSIKLFLVQGSPTGLRTAELSNWSGKAIAAPRSEMSELLERDELTSPGVYLLTGVEEKIGEEAIYIGEAENVRSRLKSHASKEFWNHVVVFVSKDENLTKAHIRYLEGKLITLLAEMSTSVLMNTASSGAKLPESDTAEMEGYLARMLQILPVLGVSSFTTSIKEPSDMKILICKIKGLVAKGYRTPGGFTVLEGSEAVAEHMPSATRTKERREDLLKRGLLRREGKRLVFTRDIEFSSPSSAASTVKGGASSGLVSWKNAEGVSLKKLEAGT